MESTLCHPSNEQQKINELAHYLYDVPLEERSAFFATQQRQREEKERQDRLQQVLRINVSRLQRMGMPITSVKQGVVTLDFNGL